MKNAIKQIIKYLYTKKIIGAKHTPEQKALKNTIKWQSKQEKKEFEKEYQLIIREEIILRIKKQTGKGTDWHISLNPKKLQEAEEMLQ